MSQQERRRWRLTQWLSFLEGLSGVAKPSLDRVNLIARQLKLNTFQCPVITVGGTNGKGSCVNVLESCYLAANYRVAAYTSPHLLQFNERIRCNGIAVSDAELCETFYLIDKARDQIPLNYFEFITLAALAIFQVQQPDVVLLEVGLGGRYDPVNCVASDVAIVTSISLDHMAILGETVEQIAVEKAGIFRHGKPVIIGDAGVPAVLQQCAQELQCEVYSLREDFFIEEIGQGFRWRYGEGAWQSFSRVNLVASNIASALMAIQLLQEPLPLSTETIQQGVADLSLLGRQQQVGSNIILDVAHNPAAMSQLAHYLMACKDKPLYGLVAMASDKLSLDCLAPMVGLIDEWHVTCFDHPRCAAPEEIGSLLQQLGIKKMHQYSSIRYAWEQVTGKLTDRESLVVFGSFYTVAAVLSMMDKSV